MNRENELLTLYWKNNQLYILDQRYLPQKIEYRVCLSYSDVVDSICEMSVRGAPAIGISAGFGVALAAREALDKGYNKDQMITYLNKAADKLFQSRPTAVNLYWALDRMKNWLNTHVKESPKQIAEGLTREAKIILEEDLENNRQIGKNGALLIPPRATVLTHCNAGALATGGYGTALGVIRAAIENGSEVHVFVDETRPLLQGARLTAVELVQEKIPATLITDNCAGSLMAQGKIDLIIVGADRIAGNGDTANKIGTYSLAVLASYHDIPFYVAAPLSTIDLSISSGDEIIVEERHRKEVTHFNERCIAPEGIEVCNPAFDVTPARLIKAIITERGLVYKPDREKLNNLFQKV